MTRSRFCLLTLLLTCLLAPLQAGNRGALADERAVRHAHALLDDRTWAQVVKIDNDTPSRRHPRQAWAMVFELAGRLWIYLPREGTQSLSLYAGHMRRDKADLREVLADINKGFDSYTVEVEDNAANVLESLSIPFGKLREGCFVESVARFFALLESEPHLRGANLLLYYAGSESNMWGHTVLCYETPEGWFYWDSRRPQADRVIRGGVPDSDLELAQRVTPDSLAPQLVQARRLPMVMEGSGFYAAARSVSLGSPSASN
jgi:hypothetical protein